MTVVVTAMFTPKEGAFNDVVAALSPAIAEVHEEPGCELYAIHEAPNGQIVMIEKWESAEHLKAHAAAPHMKAYGAKTKDMLASRVIHVLKPV